MFKDISRMCGKHAQIFDLYGINIHVVCLQSTQNVNYIYMAGTMKNDIITPIDDMSHEKCFLSVCVSHNRTSLYKYRNYERGRQFRKLWCLTPL